mgnify:CR=1 FL=1
MAHSKETPSGSTDKGAKDATPPKGERIAKVLARAGIASRREVERMIVDGRVSVNGKPIKSPALNVLPGSKILFDGQPVAEPEPPRLWRYHKKKGLVTTERDPQGRPTVFSAMPEELPRVMSVGRLDINTEGLLLMTNDGGLKRFLELPETGWLRRYRVRAYGRPNMARLEEIKKGVVVDRVVYREVELEVERQQGDNFWLTIALREGKNREIKKLLEYAGLKVNRLIRLSFGPFQLGNLDDGAVEEVPRRVLRQQLGGAWTDLLEGREPTPPSKAKIRKSGKPLKSDKFGQQKRRPSGAGLNADKGAKPTLSGKKWGAQKPKTSGNKNSSDKNASAGKGNLAPWNMANKRKR